MKSTHQLWSLVGFILASALGLLLWQFYIALVSKAGVPQQDALREIARAAIMENGNEVKPENVRSPIGFTTLGCRFWALDVINRDCFGVIVYMDSKPSRLLKTRLAYVLGNPCSYLKSLANDPRTNALEQKLKCTSEGGLKFRLVISFVRAQTTFFPDGGSENSFKSLDRVVVAGKL